MINSCKNCQSTELKSFSDDKYETEDDIIIKVSGLKCSKCDCVHAFDSNGNMLFFEYIPAKRIKSEAISGWATNYTK